MAGLAVVAAVAGLLATSDRTTPGAEGPRLYWGAYIGDHLTGAEAPWDMTAVSAFAGITQKPLSVVHFGSPFARCSAPGCEYYAFPTAAMEDVRRYGAIPLLSWASQATPATGSQADFQLRDLMEGRHDRHLRAFASAARDWGHPFFLRFNHQMNRNSWAWSEGVNGNRPGEYAAAWRHVHDVFRSAGATNVTWTWCPNVTPEPAGLASLYPGDDYVDWTCLDGYNFGESPVMRDRWVTFDDLFGPAYREISEVIAPDKPMIIGEVASTEYGGSKPAWIQDLLGRVPDDYPSIRGIVWFEKFDNQMDWPVETSNESVAAFAQGVAGDRYAGNEYSSISAQPIAPPG